jgi:sodium/hydrogen exchanger-like protein 6/7
MFGMLAQLSENFIFIYLGLSLFTQTQLVYKPMFILVTAVHSSPSSYAPARSNGTC